MTKSPLTAISAAMALAVAAVLTSCGTKGTVIRADDYDEETIVDLMNEEEPVLKNLHPTEKPKATVKHQALNTPLKGEWIIVKVGNQNIKEDEDMPYVIFNDADGRFYAYNGCNYLNGDYEYAQDGTLTFGSVITTLRSCPDITYPDRINATMKNGVKVKTRIENKNRETYLYFLTGNNDEVMVLRGHNLEVINGKWEVESIGDLKVNGDEINLFFDIPERAIHGNTSCNYFNGEIVIDPEKESSISFSQMGVSMRYCDNADTERKLLVALEETETYTLKDTNTLYLNDENGNRLITLKR